MTDTKQDAKKIEPMDASAVETPTPQPITTRPRTAYAVDTLITEVQAIYPDMEVETFGPNGRGVNLDVAFYDDDEPDLQALLGLVESEPRVAEVMRSTNDNCTIVAINNDPAIYDSRDSYGLVDAYKVLSEDVPAEPALVDPEDDTDDGSSEYDTDLGADAEEGEPEYIYRSAKTGRIVTEKYALANPDITVREEVDES